MISNFYLAGRGDIMLRKVARLCVGLLCVSVTLVETAPRDQNWLNLSSPVSVWLPQRTKLYQMGIISVINIISLPVVTTCCQLTARLRQCAIYYTYVFTDVKTHTHGLKGHFLGDRL